MAAKRKIKRRSYRSRSAAPPRRRASRRSRSMLKSPIVGNVIDGAIVGLVNNFVPPGTAYGLASPAVPLLVGYVRKNPVLQTLGGLSLGAALANVIGGKLGVIKESEMNVNPVRWL